MSNDREMIFGLRNSHIVSPDWLNASAPLGGTRLCYAASGLDRHDPWYCDGPNGALPFVAKMAGSRLSLYQNKLWQMGSGEGDRLGARAEGWLEGD